MSEISNKRMTRDDRRQQIIETALRVFGAHGFRAATTAELARQAGVSEALLYQHFSGKNELLIATIEHLGQVIYNGLQSVLAASRDPSVTMRTLFSAFSDFSRSHPEVTRFILSLSVELEDPELIRITRDTMKRSVDLLTRALENGQTHGVIRADADARMLAWTVVSVYQTYGMLQRLGLENEISAESALNLSRPFLSKST